MSDAEGSEAESGDAGGGEADGAEANMSMAQRPRLVTRAPTPTPMMPTAQMPKGGEADGLKPTVRPVATAAKLKLMAQKPTCGRRLPPRALDVEAEKRRVDTDVD